MPRAVLENYLGDFARSGSSEVYVIAGVAGNKGTAKGLGKVVIPASVWKVAVIMPRNRCDANAVRGQLMACGNEVDAMVR